MNAVSEKGWYALKLASIAISRNQGALEQLSQKLSLHYDDSEMAEIWRQARMVLKELDQYWLEEELYHILVMNSQDSAA